MRQRKMKQRKSKQSKSLAKILTLGIAAATVVSSLSVPGGLLAPETVYADDNTGTAESEDQVTEPQEKPIQFDVSIRPNDSATAYVMQVTSLADTDMRSYQYSINGKDYYPLQKLQTEARVRWLIFTSERLGQIIRFWQLAIVRLKLRETAAFRRFPVLTSFQTARR